MYIHWKNWDFELKLQPENLSWKRELKFRWIRERKYWTESNINLTVIVAYLLVASITILFIFVIVVSYYHHCYYHSLHLLNLMLILLISLIVMILHIIDVFVVDDVIHKVYYYLKISVWSIVLLCCCCWWYIINNGNTWCIIKYCTTLIW